MRGENGLDDEDEEMQGADVERREGLKKAPDELSELYLSPFVHFYEQD